MKKSAGILLLTFCALVAPAQPSGTTTPLAVQNVRRAVAASLGLTPAEWEAVCQSRLALGNRPSVNDGSGSGSTNDPPEEGYWPLDLKSLTNALWLELTNVNFPQNSAGLRLHGTVPGVPYELLSRVDLASAGWVSEGIVIGSTNQERWTPAGAVIGTRTNRLFFWARSWIPTNGQFLCRLRQHERFVHADRQRANQHAHPVSLDAGRHQSSHLQLESGL
jgi:hypothetical protein